jgi:hypothetical protein
VPRAGSRQPPLPKARAKRIKSEGYAVSSSLSSDLRLQMSKDNEKCEKNKKNLWNNLEKREK